MTFSELADTYWNSHYIAQCKPSPQSYWYVKQLKAHFGHQLLSEIHTIDILTFLRDQRFKYSPGTVNKFRAMLNTIFKRGEEWNLCHANPVEKTRSIKNDASRKRYLDREEMAKLVRASSPKFYPILVCVLNTGLRRGEIGDLKWDNVDLENRTLNIVHTKSGKNRQVPISTTLLALLKKMKAGAAGGHVFDVSPSFLRSGFEQARKKAELKNFHFHDLRHTFASYFVMATGDLPTLQRILGHSSAQMTMRYAHLADAHIEEKMKQFSESVKMPSLARHKNVPKVDGNGI